MAQGTADAQMEQSAFPVCLDVEEAARAVSDRDVPQAEVVPRVAGGRRIFRGWHVCSCDLTVGRFALPFP